MWSGRAAGDGGGKLLCFIKPGARTGTLDAAAFLSHFDVGILRAGATRHPYTVYAWCTSFAWGERERE